MELKLLNFLLFIFYGWHKLATIFKGTILCTCSANMLYIFAGLQISFSFSSEFHKHIGEGTLLSESGFKMIYLPSVYEHFVKLTLSVVNVRALILASPSHGLGLA